MHTIFLSLHVTETWLTEYIFETEIIRTGHRIFRRDRGLCGGGVLLAVKHTLTASLFHTPDSLEAISIELLGHNPIIISVVYVPPNASDKYHA